MTTKMQISTDSKFDMGRRSGPQTFCGTNSKTFYRGSLSKSFSSPNRVKIVDVEAEKVVKNMMTTLEKERKDLDELNAKLASYIVSVGSKETKNKHLLVEIEKMKEAFLQNENHIRNEYTIQIEETQSRIRELSDGISPVKAKVVSLEQTLEMKDKEITLLQKRVDELHISVQKKERTIGELEGECAVMKRQLQEIREDNRRIRMENDRIRSEQEVVFTRQIKVQNECDTLVEEKKYIEITLQAEIRELRALLSAFEFIQPNLEEVHKAEFKECIKAIQAEYNAQLAKLRAERQGVYDVEYKQLEADHSEMTARYEEECSYFESEKSAMQQRIDELESELKAVMSRLTTVRADSLDAEISTYRSLLDGKTEMDVLQDKNQIQSAFSRQSTKNLQNEKEVTGVTQVVTSQFSKSGQMLTPLSIKEIESDGNFISINNSSKQEMDISNWQIERKHAKGTETFKVPNGTKIGAEKELKIFSRQSSHRKGANDILATCSTWGSGDGQVKVIDEKGQEVIQF